MLEDSVGEKESGMEGEASAVREFFGGATVLVTGATGFIGKAAVEKLLRVCNPAALLLLVRAKGDVTPMRRTAQLFEDPVFERLKEEKPDFLKRVRCVEGDISERELGLSGESLSLVVGSATVVLHGAATVRFDEHIAAATAVNVRGTRELLRLCRRIKNLKAVTHISTAYSYCKYKDIGERFYEPPIKADNLIKICEWLTKEQLTAITPSLLGEWPNTYSFTKAVGEDVVQSCGRGLPLAVFRPAIVIGAKEEPVKGWIDNLYGPTGVLVGAGAGLMRCLYADSDCVADMVPVDMAVNLLLTITYETSLREKEEDSEAKVYNFCSSNENPVTWGEFLQSCIRHGRHAPSVKSLYYYTFTLTSNRLLFYLYSILFHLLPALFVDAFLLLAGSKLRLLKVYRKIHKFSEVIGYFSCTAWRFSTHNTRQLLSNMSAADRRLFDFDVAALDWEDFFHHNVLAIRTYIFKDPPETLARGRAKFFWLHVLHRLVQLAALLASLWALRAVYRVTSLLLAGDVTTAPVPMT